MIDAIIAVFTIIILASAAIIGTVMVGLIFIVGEPKPPISDKKREHITIAFVALVFLIIAANTIF